MAAQRSSAGKKRVMRSLIAMVSETALQPKRIVAARDTWEKIGGWAYDGSARIFVLRHGCRDGSRQMSAQQAHHWTIVVHGGAGVIERAALGPKATRRIVPGLPRLRKRGQGAGPGGSRWMRLKPC